MWQGRLTTFQDLRSGAAHTALLNAIDAALPRVHNDDVVLGGSVVDGNATITSDIDVFLVRDSVDGFERVVRTEFRGIPVDITVLSRNYAECLCDRVVVAERGTSRNAFWSLSRKDFDFIHRIGFGVVIRGRRPITIESAILCHCLAQKIAIELDSLQIDLAGAADAADNATQVTLGERALLRLIDLFNASFRVTNPGEKWRRRYLARAAEGVPGSNQRELGRALMGSALTEDFLLSAAAVKHASQLVNRWVPLLLSFASGTETRLPPRLLQTDPAPHPALSGPSSVWSSTWMARAQADHVEIVDLLGSTSIEVNWDFYAALYDLEDVDTRRDANNTSSTRIRIAAEHLALLRTDDLLAGSGR